MKKLNLILLALFTMSLSSFAQLSSRENDDTKIKLGTRPEKGDMALTFGIPITSGSEANLYDANILKSGDFLTFRYYKKKDIAIRAAVRLYTATEKASGDAFEIDPLNSEVTTFKYKSTSREYIFVPGIEKHFLKSNIFDVYTGADLLIGLGKELTLTEDENSNGDFYNRKDKQNSFILGLEGVIGANVFVAQLPISIGFEYGLGFRYAKEGKTKVKIEDDVNGSYEYSTYSGGMAIPGTEYNELKSSTFGMNTNQNVRILVNIYFGL